MKSAENHASFVLLELLMVRSLYINIIGWSWSTSLVRGNEYKHVYSFWAARG